MKNGVKAALIISAIAGGFIGATVQERISRPKIIENGAGHYDQLSGDFTWGKPEILASNYSKEVIKRPVIDNALANAAMAGR